MFRHTLNFIRLV